MKVKIRQLEKTEREQGLTVPISCLSQGLIN